MRVTPCLGRPPFGGLSLALVFFTLFVTTNIKIKQGVGMINLVLQVFFAISIWCSVSIGILRFTLSSKPLEPSQVLVFTDAFAVSFHHVLPVLSAQEWLLLGFFGLALLGAFVVTAMVLWLVQNLQYPLHSQ